MALFQSLVARMIGAGDPTRKWKAGRGSRPEFDFSRFELNHIALGAPLIGLQAFGRAEEHEGDRRHHKLRYLSQGFEVQSLLGMAIRYRAVWFDEDEEGFSSYTGATRWDGRPIEFSPETCEEEILDTFGPSEKRDYDEGYITLVYTDEETTISTIVELGEEGSQLIAIRMELGSIPTPGGSEGKPRALNSAEAMREKWRASRE